MFPRLRSRTAEVSERRARGDGLSVPNSEDVDPYAGVMSRTFARGLIRGRRARAKRRTQMLWILCLAVFAGHVALMVAAIDLAWTKDVSTSMAIGEWSLPLAAVVAAGLTAVFAVAAPVTIRRVATRTILEDAEPSPVARDDHARRVVAEAASHVGVAVPALRRVQDAYPNALMMTLDRKPTLCVTAGTRFLPAAEFEGLCVQQLVFGHFGSAKSLRRAEAGAGLIGRVAALSALVVGVCFIVHVLRGVGSGIVTWVLLIGAWCVLALLAWRVVVHQTRAARFEATKIADTMAVDLVRYPTAFVDLLERLGKDERSMLRTSPRIAERWFAPARTAITERERTDMVTRTQQELRDRADAAAAIVNPDGHGLATEAGHLDDEPAY